MRRLWEILLVLLGLALSFYISESIPRATIQRDAGASVIGLAVCIALVVLWERNRLALRSPIVRQENPGHRHSQTRQRGPDDREPAPAPPHTERSAMGPAIPGVQAKVERVYSLLTRAELFALGNTPNLTNAQRATLLAPHMGTWLRIEGVVDEVNAYLPSFVQVVIGADVTDPVKPPLTLATFKSDLNRLVALQKGARIQLAGRFNGVTAMNVGVAFDDCELLN
jgi:hypothetical protein